MNYLTWLWENGLFQRFCAALILLVIGILATRLICHIVRKTLERSRMEKAAHSLITSLTRAVLYTLLGLITASTLGIDVTSIVALASVLTLALSLALQNMVSNIIGGFTILYTHPFRSGDYVEIAGQGGTVREISMTYTKLATPDNKIIAIPNSSVVAAQIVNYTAEAARRIEVNVTASYDVPVQKVIDTLALAGTMDKVLLEPAPMAVVLGYNERGVQYSLRVWARSADYWDVTFALNQRVKLVFDDQQIPMSYPHVSIRLDRP